MGDPPAWVLLEGLAVLHREKPACYIVTQDLGLGSLECMWLRIGPGGGLL